MRQLRQIDGNSTGRQETGSLYIHRKITKYFLGPPHISPKIIKNWGHNSQLKEDNHRLHVIQLKNVFDTCLTRQLGAQIEQCRTEQKKSLYVE